MPKLTNKQVSDVAKKLKVDLNVVTVDMLKQGIKVEMEHGTVDKKTNITDDDLIMTAKIALAHYKEGLKYYDLLERLEKKLEKIAERKGLPTIFLK
jgi:hypothetical protein